MYSLEIKVILKSAFKVLKSNYKEIMDMIPAKRLKTVIKLI